MTTPFAPPLTAPDQLLPQLRDQGFAVLGAASVAALAGITLEQMHAWDGDWNALPPDLYLKDGGRYRRRRHASMTVQGSAVQQVPHRAHWQPVEYNALHGGMERWFEPMRPQTLAAPAWNGVLRALARVCDAVFAAPAQAQWFVEAHQFRIDTVDGIGRPTPEGAHRDGVDLVAVFLIEREGVKGGETRVFEAAAPAGERFTLTAPWSLLLLDDARMVHETTPIQPAAPGGHRDTLVITYRRGGFQDSPAA